MSFKNKFLLTFLFLFSAKNVIAITKPLNKAQQKSKQPTVTKVVNKAMINNKQAKEGDIVESGGQITTAPNGELTIVMGTQNLVKISSDTIVKLEPSKNNSLSLNLIKGKIDGIKKIEQKVSAPSAKAKVSSSKTVTKTDSGDMEVEGGRYTVEIKDSGDNNKTANFASYDMASVLLLKKGIKTDANQPAKNSSERIPIGVGSMISVNKDSAPIQQVVPLNNSSFNSQQNIPLPFIKKMPTTSSTSSGPMSKKEFLKRREAYYQSNGIDPLQTRPAPLPRTTTTTTTPTNDTNTNPNVRVIFNY